ncbi:DegT/DnrJ/EryC1/StrS family aminotransferase [Allorhizocola rhizosphaerae]|uniref:DegT/DnrJ/EryC1/StrS family aminotransferase n=1 Tax=Allorhizocola rhizosphaerae TaxID=1872709 RepID=UPI000E3D4FF5|nr:DegT/DnrJ/EryC1/StrS family aminotransferase [Allorhizocola rhizosphaerae]
MTNLRAVIQRLALPSIVDAPKWTLREGSRQLVIVHSADDVAESLAAQGFSTISLSLSDTHDERVLLLEGRSLLAAHIDEMLAAVRFGESYEKVGLYGRGDGAAVALHTALLTDLPLAVSGHEGSYRDLDKPALPGILRFADLPELYEAVTRLHTSGSVAEFFADAFRTPAQLKVPPLKVHFDLAARVEVSDNVDQILASGMLTQGALVSRFEEVAARRTGAETVAVSSGTAALDIAYQLLDVRDRTVLVPVNTFFATAASVDRMGGKVEFVDLELDGFGMDPKALRAALDRFDDVAAVVVVHIGGIIAPSLREVLAECAARRIPVVEDAAHALGAKLDGKLAGTFGQLATYSLHPAKVATSGEGGLLTAQDPAQLDAARKLRDHGKISISQNVHDRLGNNWRLSEVHAAVGLAHVSRLDELLAMRRSLAVWYDEHIDEVPRVKRFTLPTGVESNYYKYIAFLDESVDRADLKARLRQNHGVSLAGEVYDVLLSEQPYYAPRFAGRTFEQAQWFAKHHICLPAFPSMTTAQQRHVLNALTAELS